MLRSIQGVISKADKLCAEFGGSFEQLAPKAWHDSHSSLGLMKFATTYYLALTQWRSDLMFKTKGGEQSESVKVLKKCFVTINADPFCVKFEREFEPTACTDMRSHVSLPPPLLAASPAPRSGRVESEIAVAAQPSAAKPADVVNVDGSAIAVNAAARDEELHQKSDGRIGEARDDVEGDTAWGMSADDWKKATQQPSSSPSSQKRAQSSQPVGKATKKTKNGR